MRQLRDCAEAGLCLAEAARRCGMPEDRAAYWAARLGLIFQRRPRALAPDPVAPAKLASIMQQLARWQLDPAAPEKLASIMQQLARWRWSLWHLT